MAIIDWLFEKTNLVFFFIIIIFFIYFWIWRILSERIRLKKLIRKQNKQQEEIKKQKLKLKDFDEKLKLDEKRLKQEQKRLDAFVSQILKKEEMFVQQFADLSLEKKKLYEEIEKDKIERKWIIKKLEANGSLSIEEAKNILFSLVKKDVDQELIEYKKERVKQTKKEIEKSKAEATKAICLALETISSELVFTITVSKVYVENNEMINKIIGKEGRNINAFRQVTGTELIISKKNNDLSVQVSCFNSLRRELACQTLRILIKERKFSPKQIEKTYKKVNSEVNDLIVTWGKEVLDELEIVGVRPELVECLGKLKYRTSYGQNVLEHCLEVAKISGSIAAELGLDVFLARRTGLFHDIGKSVENAKGQSHVLNGIDLAKKYQEPEEVVNAIASHHYDFPADNFYSLIVLAADTLSAARLGARNNQLEAYLERMNKLEKIANDFPGIKKSYAFQSGREIWVIADAEKLDDYKTWKISQEIKEKIKNEITIPGEVTIHFIREKRIVYKLNTNREINKENRKKNNVAKKTIN